MFTLFSDRASTHLLHSMKGWDPEGQHGPRKPLPDAVQILEPPVEKVVLEPSSEQRNISAAVIAPPVDEGQVYQEGQVYEQQTDYPEQPVY